MALAKNKKELFKVLKTYADINGISRYEDEVVEQLKKNTKGLGFKNSRDGMGSLIMNKTGDKKGPRIQIAAHMDEVGYLVRDITKDGFLKLSMVGGIWPAVNVAGKATVVNSKGKEFIGVFGHTSIHIMKIEARKVAPTINDLYVDLGAKDKKEIEKMGIEPGDRVYMHADSFMMNNDIAVGKAMDNRAGVTVIDQLAHALKGKKNPNDLFIVGTVQEEVGTRGAKTSVSQIKPDVAIAIDTCASHDTPGAIPGIQTLGNGAAIRIQDSGTMMDPKLVEYIYALGKKHKIPVYKYVAQGGGTDAAELQYGEGGVATLTISIPQRYLHSPHGASSLLDIQASIDLLKEFVLNFDKKAFDKISYK